MAVNDTPTASQTQPTAATPAPDLSAILAKLAKLEQIVAGLQPVKGDDVRLPVRQEPPPPISVPAPTPAVPEPQLAVVPPLPPPRFIPRVFTDPDIRRIVREEIPVTLRRVDDNRVGNFLKLTPPDTGGNTTAYWGPGGGLEANGDEVVDKAVVLREYDADGNLVAAADQLDPTAYADQAAYEAALAAIYHDLEPTWDDAFKVKGTPVLYKIPVLREYDADGNIVAPGSEINPSDYASQDLYEAALTAEGHDLEPTWDWMRAGTDVTP